MSHVAQGAAPAAPGLGDPTSEGTLYCSFCFKSHRQVRKLISGPAGIFICDECVESCNHVISGRPVDAAKTTIDSVPTERLLERLSAIEHTLQGKGNQLQQVVEALRSRDVSWAVVGAALGISRQSAWERFA